MATRRTSVTEGLCAVSEGYCGLKLVPPVSSDCDGKFVQQEEADCYSSSRKPTARHTEPPSPRPWCQASSLQSKAIKRAPTSEVTQARDGELWKVESVTTGKQCYIPSNHIAEISHRWLYKGIDRAKAEELLLLPSNREGSFLIRESQTRKGCYSLSVRHTNFASPDSVKHYRINCLDNNWLYISPRLTFSSMQELVDFYSETGEGLCCCLRESCFIQGSTSGFLHNVSKPVEIKPVLNWQEINRSDLVVEGSLPEDHPISLGLREAVTSYLFITEDLLLDSTLNAMQKRSKTT